TESEEYLLAAADQPSGPRAARLAQVIKAKYDAGLLKPYDYVKGYERMNKWMETSTPVPTYANSISPESRRRILAALNGFRPKFRQIARTLTDVDLVFIEEAMERWMLEYDRAFASIHTPSCIWRRTGEIQKANQEFANLTGVPASLFRNGLLCVYELMDEDSAVRFWEGYAKVGLDAVHQLISGGPGSDSGWMEQYNIIKCCFSATIRRDAWGVPVAIMGQFIPQVCSR
ncbi:hypothetical protein TREMEDRAFT_30910, partial [Tremella mesenterica DSM 1558]|uniref:uncharacterized protein n=1 Tax=Tremella mesenterica (strain ATCC 24925 / CBS 8224 / DSM 1558 / NBRC 9311 / NRRL Y-6157 / RJB 2259-6 / UBC 559-6) TaxID=578456 RepID=UPI0003F49018